MRILVIEDEEKIADFIRRGLELEKFAVDVAEDGLSGQLCAESVAYDVIILDIILPGKNGLELLRELRRKKVTTPVLLLTGNSQVADKVNGFSSGADDYLTKPFDIDELCARVTNLCRRRESASQTRMIAGDLVMDLLAREVRYKGELLTLSRKEFAVLECLLRRPGQVINRTIIEQRVWDQEFVAGSSNLVDIYIGHLRKKIGADGAVLIQTVYGTGYRLKLP